MDWVANFSALPVWAQVLAIVTFAASAGVFIVVTRLGISAGKSGGAAATTSTATVAAVIVDPTALNAAAGAVDGLTVAVTEANAIGRQHVSVTAQLAKAVEDLGEGVDRLRDEVIRSAAKLK